MSSRKAFEEKIIDDLIKTGLPTEIKVHKLLHKRGWNVQSQYSFIDESGTIRSCDFKASFYGILVSEDEDSDQRYVCQLFIECKKSDKKPWVFYTGPEPSDLEEHIAALFEPAQYWRGRKELYTGLEKIKNIHNNVHSPIAYSVQIPFLRKTGENNYQGFFYTAEMQVLKAIYNSEPIPKENINYLNVYPLIIFDGNMFKCDLAGDDLVVSRIDYVRYSSSGIPENKKDVLIDVVTMDYLELYIELVESEISHTLPRALPL